MNSSSQMGYLLRGSTSSFVAGCRVASFEHGAPALGALARSPVSGGYQAYGLVYDIHIADDGLVRQLVTAEGVDAATIADNRQNRTVPVEISLLAVGYALNGAISHLLPPRPPLSLEEVTLCADDELRRFTAAGRFGYFRHVLRSPDLPVGEILAAHLQLAARAHASAGDPAWLHRASAELITLLRDDYAALMTVLNALSEIY
ncbi:MAG: hypothetical protein L0Z70_02660 [Chloroflexi bacterium]|nr:hypothetical protein [Chloroflexota bacterium]